MLEDEQNVRLCRLRTKGWVKQVEWLVISIGGGIVEKVLQLKVESSSMEDSLAKFCAH